jgi:hypothetical protein
MKPFRVGDQDVKQILDFTRSVIALFGPRVVGTRSCKRSAEYISRHLKRFCDQVAVEKFTLHPESMWDLGVVFAGAYTLGSLLILIPKWGIYLAAVVYSLGLVYGVTNFVFFRDTFDFLFPSAQGRNLCGVIEPAQPARQQILVVGHHDSPRIFNFLTQQQKWYGDQSGFRYDPDGLHSGGARGGRADVFFHQ